LCYSWLYTVLYQLTLVLLQKITIHLGSFINLKTYSIKAYSTCISLIQCHKIQVLIVIIIKRIFPTRIDILEERLVIITVIIILFNKRIRIILIGYLRVVWPHSKNVISHRGLVVYYFWKHYNNEKSVILKRHVWYT